MCEKKNSHTRYYFNPIMANMVEIDTNEFFELKQKKIFNQKKKKWKWKCFFRINNNRNENKTCALKKKFKEKKLVKISLVTNHQNQMMFVLQNCRQ